MSTSTLSYQLFIGGEWADSSGDEALDVINPATEEVIGTVPQATPADVDRAVTAAREAFDEGPWSRMTPRERGAIMLKMGAAFARRREQIVDLNIREAGSTRMLAEFLQRPRPLSRRRPRPVRP
jgi:aldehyde dehydrogenase (NAD+)